MVAMDRLFRLAGGLKRDPAIDRWLDAQTAELGAIARRWFDELRACGEDVRELLHDGCPTACVEDAAFGYVNVFSAHVNVGFFQGAELFDPDRLLEGKGKRMRHVKLRPGSDIDPVTLSRLIDQAYRDMRGRLSS
jgi:hypothetical protein